MVRKRTLHDMDAARSPSADDESASNAHDLPSPSSSTASHTSIPSLAISSSPDTSTASSPMVRRSSSSSHSLRSTFEQAFDSIDSDEEDVKPNVGRPKMKRRRTGSSASGGSFSTPKRRGSRGERRGNGKNGEDVWTPDLEEAYHKALQLLPPLGRRKILIGKASLGRNELIAWYLERVTGKTRGRKQISSHLQVLKDDAKKVLAKRVVAAAEDDTPEDAHLKGEEARQRRKAVDFLRLVSNPLDLEGDIEFAPGAALEFFGSSGSSWTSEGDVSLDEDESLLPVEDGSCRDGLLSPYTSTFLRRSPSVESAAPSPVHSPSFSTARLADSLYATPMTPTSSITTAMKDMHFPSPPSSTRHPISCPIAPVTFSLWAQDAQAETTHVFANLDGSAGTPPTGTVSLEDVPLASLRFPGLADMNDHLPCQFLHVKVNLDVPTFDAGTSTTQLHAKVDLTALQELDLIAVTSIYSEGTPVLCLEEQLPAPTRVEGLAPSQDASSASTSSTPPPSNPLRHNYSYQAPFASDFWSIFLRGAFGPEQPVASEVHLPSFAKTGAERADFAMAISGLAVVQEFVVRSEEPNGISPGSKLGDVVLVLTYDFECETSSPAGAVKVSFLSTTRNALPTSLPPFPPLPLPLPVANVDPPPPRARHSRHGSKPSLSLHIPPPATFLNASSGPSTASTGPTTPLPQVLHTPTAPPPVNAGPSSPAQRDRLEQIWARTSHDWEQSSPALMGAFPSHDARSASDEDSVDRSRPRSHDYGDSHYPRTSQAMHDFTTSAIAAGTPLLAAFPPVVQSHGTLFGTPFVVHPAHKFDKEDEVDFSAFGGGRDSVAMEVFERGERDYFSGRMGSASKYAST